MKTNVPSFKLTFLSMYMQEIQMSWAWSSSNHLRFIVNQNLAYLK